jgi:hypothetical protein
MVIQMPPADLVERKSNRGPQLTRWRGSGIADACDVNGFRPREKLQTKTAGNLPRKLPEIAAYATGLFRNNAARDELARIVRWLRPAPIPAKELTMRNRILAIAAIAGAISVPVAAQAQSDTVGIVRGGSVIINDDQGIAVDQRPAFREYIVRERVPNYTIPDRVIVGGVLPETGVTYYDVPQTYGVTPYRYTVVNGRTVLVEPRTRRIVQVVE